MKKFIFILSLCLFIPVSALGYQDYNNYTVIDRNNNASGFVQRQGNSYYSSNSSTYSPQKIVCTMGILIHSKNKTMSFKK